MACKIKFREVVGIMSIIGTPGIGLAGTTMMNTPAASQVVDPFDTISSAILQKQQELTHLNDYRFKSLENTILEKTKQLEKERQQYKQLKTDFDYNLKLIEGRDEELKQFDQKFIEMRHEMKEKYVHCIQSINANYNVL